jgi:hypothetical protein
MTYYWRVDEVNDLHPDSPWKGDVWSFTIAPGQTNLIVNGDFEASPTFPDQSAGTWENYETTLLGGWNIEHTFPTGNEYPQRIKIWDTFMGPVFSGTQCVELDSTSPTKISQVVSTIPRATYELSYAWGPCPNVVDNQMKVWIDDQEVAYHSASGGDTPINWTYETYQFTASSTSTTIAFAEIGPDDQHGMLLDAVSLVRIVLDVQVIMVPGTACFYFAGQDRVILEADYIPDPVGRGNPDNLYNDTALTANSMPPHVSVCSGCKISISAEGIWGHPGLSGPDGYDYSLWTPTIYEYVILGGISRVTARRNALIGVFLTDDPPDPESIPPELTSPTTTPFLQQAFYIGSNLENIIVPEGATRLFFGLNDGYEWNNNVGSLEVTVSGNLITEPNLVGWWKFDDGFGTTAIDSSGNGFNINLFNTTWEDGIFGGSVHFHGLGRGHLENFIYSNNAITVCSWVWHDIFRTGQIERYVTVGPSVAVIRKESNGSLHFYINTNGNLRHLRVSGVLREGRWHHVAGTWDGITQRLYINGLEIARQRPGGVLGNTSSVNVSLGSEPLNGMLDDVRIYNRKLNAEEI